MNGPRVRKGSRPGRSGRGGTVSDRLFPVTRTQGSVSSGVGVSRKGVLGDVLGPAR